MWNKIYVIKLFTVENDDVLHLSIIFDILLQKQKSDSITWHGISAVEVVGVEVEEPPQGLEEAFATLLTSAALKFVADLTRQFNSKVDLVSACPVFIRGNEFLGGILTSALLLLLYCPVNDNG